MGGNICGHSKITQAQIKKDAEAALRCEFPPGTDGAYEKGEIEVLESSYYGDKATIVVTVGSVRGGSPVPASLDLKTEMRAQVASTDTIPWKLRLDYEWGQGEWSLRRLDNPTSENK